MERGPSRCVPFSSFIKLSQTRRRTLYNPPRAGAGGWKREGMRDFCDDHLDNGGQNEFDSLFASSSSTHTFNFIL
jgi:hypothetical protein